MASGGGVVVGGVVGQSGGGGGSQMRWAATLGLGFWLSFGLDF